MLQTFAFNYAVKLPLQLMQKWLVLILLITTTVGTFVPCCLVDNCNQEEAANTQTENRPKQEGACSPFFACVTCSGFTHMSKPVQISELVKEKQVHYETLIVFNPSTYTSSFWQPPRLS